MDNYWKLVGKFFGYPDCCIDFFIKRASNLPIKKLTKKQEEVHGNRGFVPCEKCAEKVTKETLHTLIKDRICNKDFPNENDKQLKEYLNNIYKDEF